MLAAIRRGVQWQTANRSVYPNGSYGNGGAMRAAVVGLFFAEAHVELRIARIGPNQRPKARRPASWERTHEA